MHPRALVRRRGPSRTAPPAPVRNVEPIIGGMRGDAGLTDRGREQAHLLQQRLRTEELRAGQLYASTLPRGVGDRRLRGAGAAASGAACVPKTVSPPGRALDVLVSPGLVLAGHPVDQCGDRWVDGVGDRSGSGRSPSQSSIDGASAGPLPG
jgi:hypothetical protein